MKNYIVTEKVTAYRTYVTQATTATSAKNKVENLSDDMVEIHSLYCYDDNSKFTAEEMSEKAKEDFVFKQALKGFTEHEEPGKVKRKRRTKKEMLEARKLESEKNK